jgi:hypothetical protein
MRELAVDHAAAAAEGMCCGSGLPHFDGESSSSSHSRQLSQLVVGAMGGGCAIVCNTAGRSKGVATAVTAHSMMHGVCVGVHTERAAAAAGLQRMSVMRRGCRSIITVL